MTQDQSRTITQITEALSGNALKERKGGRFYFNFYLTTRAAETPIESLDLGVRAYNSLKRAGYSTIGELAEAIATGTEISIGDLANEIISQINPNAKIICDEDRLRPDKSEVNRLLGDNTKIKALTDWEQKYTFSQGIAETIEWLRHNLDKYKTDIYNV